MANLSQTAHCNLSVVCRSGTRLRVTQLMASIGTESLTNTTFPKVEFFVLVVSKQR